MLSGILADGQELGYASPLFNNDTGQDLQMMYTVSSYVHTGCKISSLHQDFAGCGDDVY